MRKVLYVLGQLGDRNIAWLAVAGAQRSVAAGTTLIREGEATSDLSIVLAGRLSVSIEGVGEVAQVGAGEILGEVSFVDSRAPLATVRAVEDCRVLSVPTAAIRAKLRDDREFAANFYLAVAMFLADRLRDITLSQKPASPRSGWSDADAEGELSPELLDTVHVAGVRFEHLLKQLGA
jgi:CRP/FNR family cyclic AMP-dependent transcriptional regulator